MKSLILFGLVSSLGASFNNIKNVTAPTAALNTVGTIYEDHSKQTVDAYYKDIKPGDKGEVLLTKLQKTLSTGQKKVNYSSGDTSSSNWSGYYLYERNYDLSPLEASELSGSYKKSGIWINSLYSTRPIYIENKINSGNYKLLNSDGTYKTGTFAVGRVQFDREHVFPKSFGFNYKSTAGVSYKDLTAGCDAQNLHIGEHCGNSDGHSNLAFGDVKDKNASTAIYSGLDASEIVGYVGKNKTGQDVFEPLEKDKGDIARTCFYMAARYHTYEEITSVDKSPALKLENNVQATKSTYTPEQTKNGAIPYGQLDDLLNWNIIDPVDKYEVHRNNLVYNAVQFNRNPFVDYPSWAEACFKPETSKGIDFTDFKSVENTSTPNPDKPNPPTPEPEPQPNPEPQPEPQPNPDPKPEPGPTPDPEKPVEPQHTYILTLKTNEKFKPVYECLSQFDPSGFEISLTQDGVEIPNVTYELYTGDQILTSKYTMLGIGEMKVHAVCEIAGKRIVSQNTITIKLELSIVQLAIVSGVVLLIIVLIILFVVWASKRKNRKKLKQISNKLEKVNKKKKR